MAGTSHHHVLTVHQAVCSLLFYFHNSGKEIILFYPHVMAGVAGTYEVWAISKVTQLVNGKAKFWAQGEKVAS